MIERSYAAPVPALARLLVVNGVVRVAGAASGQLLAFLVADRYGRGIGFASALMAAMGAAFFVTELLGSPVVGRLADRYGASRVLKTGPLLGALAAALTAATALLGDAAAVAIVILLVARLIEGSSAACVVPPTLVAIARATPGSAVGRTRAMAVFEIGSLVGIVAGYALAGLAWEAFGRGAFLLLSPLYAIAWLVVPRLPHRPSIHTRGETVGAIVLRLLRKGALPFAVAWLAVNAIVGLWVQYVPLLLKSPVRMHSQDLVGGFSGGAIGVAFGAWGLTFLLGLAAWSWLGGAMPRRRVMTIALAGMLGLTICLALANHGPDGLVLAIGAVCVLVQSGFTPSAFAHLADITESLDGSRGTALGLYSLFLGLGQLAGGLLGAPVVAHWQMDGLLGLTVLLVVVAFAGVAWMPGAKRARAPVIR